MAGEMTSNLGVGANGDSLGASTCLMTAALGSLSQALGDAVSAAEPAKIDKAYGWVVRLMRLEGPGILRMLYRILGHEADVMDAYQDTFCKLALHGKRSRLKNAKAYAYRTASNIAIGMIRMRNRRRAHWPAIAAGRSDAMSKPSPRPDKKDRLEDLRRAIAALPPHLRHVVVLRDLCHQSYGEVSRCLGIEPTTARVYRRHAVVMLTKLLSKGGDHDSFTA